MQQTTKSLFILVAEDDAQIRLSLDITLRRAGHQTLLAASGDALLEAVEQMPLDQLVRVDLLVTDINMPGTQGGGVIRALDALGLCLPVVVITAYGSVALSDDLARRGAIRILRKPFLPEDLVIAVAQTYLEFKAASVA
jgi:two-component system response regulator FlrC